MIRPASLLRFLSIYTSFGFLEIQRVFQYNAWFWVELGRGIIAMVIMTAFWKAIYGNQTEVAGLSLTTTLNYVILARALNSANASSVYWWIAGHISKGELELQLLRPLDFQMLHLFRDAMSWSVGLMRSLPALLIGVLLFSAQLPTDFMAYIAFAITFFLGGMVMFFFEFMLGCIAFYTTEVWGLSVLREGIALFFSGAYIPLDFLPETFRVIASLTPFAQALYVPISFLSGVRDPSSLGAAVLTQLISILILASLSRWIFSRAVRVLTVQGG